MRAVVFEEFGGPEVLRVMDVPLPDPGPGDVLIRVRVVCIGRLLDLGARAGKLPFARIEFPHILGAEHAGDVVAVGADVQHIAVGDRVAATPTIACGTCRHCLVGNEHICSTLRLKGIHENGAYAEYTVVPGHSVQRIPDDMSYEDAAAVALSGATGVLQLETAGQRPGDWVLVQGGFSAIGSVTAAVAAHLGSNVILTTRDPAKAERLSGLEVAATLDNQAEDFVDQVRALTGGAGADIVIDNLGDPDVWDRSLAALAPGGALVTSGAFLGGACRVDVRALYTLSKRIIGVRTHNRAAFGRIWEYAAAGVRAPVDRTFLLEEAVEAHRYVESSSNVGRVMLVVE